MLFFYYINGNTVCLNLYEVSDPLDTEFMLKREGVITEKLHQIYIYTVKHSVSRNKRKCLASNTEILLKPFLGVQIQTGWIHLCPRRGRIPQTGNNESLVFPNWGLQAGVSFYFWERYISKGKRHHGLVSCKGSRFSFSLGPLALAKRKELLWWACCKTSWIWLHLWSLYEVTSLGSRHVTQVTYLYQREISTFCIPTTWWRELSF